MAKLNMAYEHGKPSRLSWQNWTWHKHGKPSRLSWQNWTWHMNMANQAACHGKTEHGIFVKFKKPAKLLSSYLPTAVVLLAGVTISGTPCPRHFTVPFGAEAPSDHVVQAWAIPPPSWGLLSQWHRQETTTPETNGASSARTQRHS